MMQRGTQDLDSEGGHIPQSADLRMILLNFTETVMEVAVVSLRRPVANNFEAVETAPMHDEWIIGKLDGKFRPFLY